MNDRLWPELMGEIGMEQEKKGHPFLLGCAIVLAIFLVLLAVLGRAGYSYIRSGMAKERESISARFREQYDREKAEGKLSAEQQEVFGELVEASKRPEPSFFAVGAMAMTLAASQGGTETEQQDALAAARDLRDILRKDPAAGMDRLGEVMSRHEQTFERAKRLIKEQKRQQDRNP